MADDKLFDVDFSSLTDTEPITMEEVNTEKVVEEVTVGDSDDTSETTTEESPETPENKTETEPKEDLLDIGTLNGEEPEESSEKKEASTTEEKISVEDTKASPSSEGDSSPIAPFASLLHEKGFLPNLDWDKFNGSDNKIEALAEAMRSEIEAANYNFINSFPPDLIETAKAVANGVPFKDLKDSTIKTIRLRKNPRKRIIRKY